jgi:hypothetical protein
VRYTIDRVVSSSQRIALNSARLSSEVDDASSGHQMRRVNVSPSVSERQLNIESEAYSDDDSIDETTEVENALNVDNELDDTEDHVS